MPLVASLGAGPTACIAGVDEAGRGPLAGDVVAAAVIPGPGFVVDSVNDSKKMSPGQRERAYELIVTRAECYAVGRASVAEIDRINILQASLLAMARALDGLGRRPDLVYVDGVHCPVTDLLMEAVPGGDGRIAAVAAASIIAKVERDRDMVALESRFPGYGFAQHKGYPTRAHLEALERLGPCPVHRRSFGPVTRCLQQAEIQQTGEIATR